jgi:signal transduction histidine kinase
MLLDLEKFKLKILAYSFIFFTLSLIFINLKLPFSQNQDSNLDNKKIYSLEFAKIPEKFIPNEENLKKLSYKKISFQFNLEEYQGDRIYRITTPSVLKDTYVQLKIKPNFLSDRIIIYSDNFSIAGDQKLSEGLKIEFRNNITLIQHKNSEAQSVLYMSIEKNWSPIISISLLTSSTHRENWFTNAELLTSFMLGVALLLITITIFLYFIYRDVSLIPIISTVGILLIIYCFTLVKISKDSIPVSINQFNEVNYTYMIFLLRKLLPVSIGLAILVFFRSFTNIKIFNKFLYLNFLINFVIFLFNIYSESSSYLLSAMGQILNISIILIGFTIIFNKNQMSFILKFIFYSILFIGIFIISLSLLQLTFIDTFIFEYIDFYRCIFILFFLYVIVRENQRKIVQDKQATMTELIGTQKSLEYEKRNKQEQEELINILAHEIKTPLMAQEYLISSIKKNTNTSPAVLDYLNIFQTTINQVDDVINRILNGISFSSFPKLVFEEINLSKLISRVVEVLPYSSEIDIRCNIHYKIISDSFYLSAILQNLIENAQRYKSPHSIIHINISKINRSSLLISISNSIYNGHSLELDKLFVKFYRGSTSHGVPGSGLGLWIASRFINQLGSNIDVRLVDDVITFDIVLENQNTNLVSR